MYIFVQVGKDGNRISSKEWKDGIDGKKDGIEISSK